MRRSGVIGVDAYRVAMRWDPRGGCHTAGEYGYGHISKVTSCFLELSTTFCIGLSVTFNRASSSPSRQ